LLNIKLNIELLNKEIIMVKLLNAVALISILFGVSSIVAETTEERTKTCQEQCQLNYPDTTSDGHKSCMTACIPSQKP